jgi:C-terminal processing protease CtpA/Prc
VAFLADGRTFGNGERMLETIEAYHWGEIVGAASGGAVYTPNWSNLPGGWTVAWSGRRALKHDGKTLLNRTGIRPTVPAARTLRGIAEGRDEVVERAVEVVSR